MSEAQRSVLLAFSGILGLVVGSFLNVCIFRLPRNCMSIRGPRSRCPKCMRLIAWYDNLPVLSWILLLGRCRSCRAPISPRYALVELLTGGLYLWAGARVLQGPDAPPFAQAASFLVQAWFIGALVVCAFIDLEFRILPDEVTKSGIVVGLLAAAAAPFLPFLQGDLPGALRLLHAGISNAGLGGGGLGSAARAVQDFQEESPRLGSLAASALGAAAGAGIIYSVGVLGKLLFRKRIRSYGETEAMGFGDVKVMAMIGGVLGWQGVVLTIVIACLGGTLFGVGKLCVKREMGYVPFGPFLSLGALAMLLAPRAVHGALAGWMGLMHRFSEWLLGIR
jgi:leader peptidase (prepilin peptidase)/N-methyltransferase